MMILQQTLIVDNLLKEEKIWKISLDAVWFLKEACRHLKSWEEAKKKKIGTICIASGMFQSDHSR